MPLCNASASSWRWSQSSTTELCRLRERANYGSKVDSGGQCTAADWLAMLFRKEKRARLTGDLSVPCALGAILVLRSFLRQKSLQGVARRRSRASCGSWSDGIAPDWRVREGQYAHCSQNTALRSIHQSAQACKFSHSLTNFERLRCLSRFPRAWGMEAWRAAAARLCARADSSARSSSDLTSECMVVFSVVATRGLVEVVMAPCWRRKTKTKTEGPPW